MAIILESKTDSAISPFTEQEKELIHKLRAMLKDSPDYNVRTLNTLVERNLGERWSDELLLIYIQIAMNDFNATGGAITYFTIDNYPIGITGTILMGAMIFALIGESVVQAGHSFSYSDNGISLAIDLSGKYMSIVGALKGAYDQAKVTAKQSITRPSAAALRSQTWPVRVRSYSNRMWVYR